VPDLVLVNDVGDRPESERTVELLEHHIAVLFAAGNGGPRRPSSRRGALFAPTNLCWRHVIPTIREERLIQF
jgi:hypothetical protein